MCSDLALAARLAPSALTDPRLSPDLDRDLSFIKQPIIDVIVTYGRVNAAVR
jgi:hypothetical protein